MDKKGVADLLLVIGQVAFVLAFAALMSYWINSAATGQTVKEEALAKQAALLIDSARSGSIIFISANVTIEGKEAVAGNKRYGFYNPHQISYRQIDGGTEIKVG